ncbi:MAG: TonB-dependent receptor [Steroidobacteraceae bacterium]
MFLQSMRPALRWLCVGAGTVTGTLSSTYAVAQTEPLEEVVVVGSRIPQAQNQAVPVTVITSQQLEQRGYATVQQALDDLSNNSGGGFDQQIGLSFTPSASSLNLRDLGVGRALILLDGRRMPIFPIGWNGTDSFVDLGGIPAAAVERIEVLSEGASAIYGSEAMSGVVNIVLKRRADNEIALRYGDTTGGGGAEQRVQLTTGAESEGSNASVFVEYYRHKPLWMAERERTRSDILGGVNGTGPGAFSKYGYLGTYEGYNFPYTVYPVGVCDTSNGSPGRDANGYCLFNKAAYRQAWPDIKSLSATVKFDQEINDNISLFAMMNVRNAKTTTQIEPLDFDTLDVGFVFAPGASNNPTGALVSAYRRMPELGPRRTQYDNQSYNTHVGLKGNLLDRIDWQFGLQSARLQLTTTESGLVLSDRMYDALSGVTDFNGDGTPDPLNLSQPIPGYIAAQLEYQPVSLSQSRLGGADLQVSSDLFAMRSGTAKLAAALEYFKESYFDHPDAELIAENVPTRSASNAEGQRSRRAIGVELQLPVLKQLQVNIAGRYDAYQDVSDVGGALSPRIALEYRPTSSLLLRASTGRSFRAPDMPRLFGGSTFGYQQLINTPQCIADGGRGRGDTSVASCYQAVYVGVGKDSSLKLKEERGTNYGLGAFWKPSEQWSASLDFFAIDLRQLVQTPDGQYVLDRYAADRSFSTAVLPGYSGDCFVSVCLELQPLNIAYKKVSGVDASSNYQWPTDIGRFSAGLNASYLFKVRMREAFDRPEVDVLREGRLGEAARLKGGVDLGWSRDVWAVNTFVNYIGGFTPLDTTIQNHIGSFTTVNASVGYTLPTKAVAQLGVNNLFDRMPPVDKQRGNLSQPFYHQQFHNVDGASWYVSFRQPF